MGFDGVISDFLQGPPEILGFLNSKSKLYNRAVSARDHDPETRKRVEAAFGAGMYVAGEFTYTVREAYGQKSTRINQMFPSRFLRTNVDQDAKNRLQQEDQELFDRLKANEGHLGELCRKQVAFEQQFEQLMAQRVYPS